MDSIVMASFFVRDDPMQLCQWKLFAEGRIDQIHPGKKLPTSVTEEHWLKIQGISSNWAMFSVPGRTSEYTALPTVQVESLFIDRIVIQRIVSRYMSHADDRIMTFPITGMTKMKRIITVSP